MSPAITTRVAMVACLTLFVLAHFPLCFPDEAHPLFRLAIMASLVASYVVWLQSAKREKQPIKSNIHKGTIP